MMSIGRTVVELVIFLNYSRQQDKNILILVNKYVFSLWCEVLAVIFFLYYLCSLRENSHAAPLSLVGFGQPAISDLNATALFLTHETQALIFHPEIFQPHSWAAQTSLFRL